MCAGGEHVPPLPAGQISVHIQHSRDSRTGISFQPTFTSDKNAKFFSSDFHEGLIYSKRRSSPQQNWEHNIQRFFCLFLPLWIRFRIRILNRSSLTQLRIRCCAIFTSMGIGSNHRVPTPPPPLREGRQVEISWTRKLPPSSHWDRPAIQPNHIKFRTYRPGLLRRCELPYKRMCLTNSGGPLVNSVLWGSNGTIKYCSLLLRCPMKIKEPFCCDYSDRKLIVILKNFRRILFPHERKYLNHAVSDSKFFDPDKDLTRGGKEV